METYNTVGDWINLHAQNECLPEKLKLDCTHLNISGDFLQDFI